jgi:ribosomal protein S18 acetylase RimI-like enzyme
MIRQATQEDAELVIQLMYTAIGGIAHTLSGTDNVEDTMRVLASFFRQRGNRISFENVLVKEVKGRVIAFMLAYHGSRAKELDLPFLSRLRDIGQLSPWIEREARQDEYYLDCVAVDSDFQGRGIGTELLHLFERNALELGYPKIMLLVDEENVPAQLLYKKLGYTEDGKIQVSGRAFYRMIKQP